MHVSGSCRHRGQRAHTTPHVFQVKLLRPYLNVAKNLCAQGPSLTRRLHKRGTSSFVRMSRNTHRLLRLHSLARPSACSHPNLSPARYLLSFQGVVDLRVHCPVLDAPSPNSPVAEQVSTSTRQRPSRWPQMLQFNCCQRDSMLRRLTSERCPSSPQPQ